MSRLVVASEFDDGRRFFAGPLQVVPSFGVATVADSGGAFSLGSREAADAVALGLTELCHGLPPGDARTWFVVELPEPRS